MDSAGLGALIGGIRRAREAGGDVAVACSRPTLTRLLHTTGFDRIVVGHRDRRRRRRRACQDAQPATLSRRQQHVASAELAVRPVDVVDVGRTGTARAPPAPAPPPRPARRGAPPRVTPPAGSRPGCGRGRRGRCPRGCRPARRRPRPARRRSVGCMRLTMSARTVMSASPSFSAKYRASSIVSRRGDATSTKAVSSSDSSWSTASARSRKPSSIPSKAWKKAMASSITSAPTTLATVRRKAWAATFTAFTIPRPGDVIIRNRRWSRKRRQPARGVDEVEGVAGGRRVDDDEVEVACAGAARRASPSPCTPACPTARPEMFR